MKILSKEMFQLANVELINLIPQENLTGHFLLIKQFPKPCTYYYLL